MNRHLQDDDQTFDQNLRLIGRHLQLPPLPSDAQRSAWYREPAEARPQPTKGVTMRSRFWKIGPVIAAAAIISLAFLLPAGQPRVEAATIFKSLRQTEWHGLRMILDNLVVEGIAIDGQIHARFGEPITLASLADGGSASAVEAATMDVSIAADDTAEPEIAGLDIEVDSGLTVDGAWMFVRIGAMPSKLLAAHPELGLVQMMFGKGVLIDLGDMVNLGSMLQVGGDGPGGPANAQSSGVTTELVAKIATERNDRASSPDDSSNTGSMSVRIDPVTINLGTDEDGQSDELQQVLESVLAGNASHEQLERLVTELEREAGDVRIETLEPGLHVLYASGFDADDEVIRPDSQVEISYREGTGVERIDVTSIGSAAGRITIEFTDDLVDAMAGREKWQEAGVPVMDVPGLMKMGAGLAKP